MADQIDADIRQDKTVYALRQGDNALVLGQRLGEWTGKCPALELEMAMANLALDLIGESQLFLNEAGELEGEGRDGDDFAFKRDVLDFKNLLIVEQPNGDWAFSMVRHYLYSVYHRLYFDRLRASTHEPFAEIAQKVYNEVGYHVRFARDWILRLGGGTEESHRRLVAAVDNIWRFTGEMFVDDDLEGRLAKQGVGVRGCELEDAWRAEISGTFEEAGVELPEAKQMILGGRDGHHSEYLGHMLSELQYLQRSYPGLEW